MRVFLGVYQITYRIPCDPLPGQASRRHSSIFCVCPNGQNGRPSCKPQTPKGWWFPPLGQAPGSWVETAFWAGCIVQQQQKTQSFHFSDYTFDGIFLPPGSSSPFFFVKVLGALRVPTVPNGSQRFPTVPLGVATDSPTAKTGPGPVNWLLGWGWKKKAVTGVGYHMFLGVYNIL